MVKTSKYKEHLNFNKKCFDQELIPKALRVKSVDNIPASHRAAKICSLTFVKNRIQSCKLKLKELYRNNELNAESVRNILPKHIFNQIENRLNKKCQVVKLKTRLRQKAKFSRLKSQSNQKFTNKLVTPSLKNSVIIEL